jgi:hypothetical protein
MSVASDHLCMGSFSRSPCAASADYCEKLLTMRNEQVINHEAGSPPVSNTVNLFGVLLVALMLASLVAVGAGLSQRLFPDLRPGALIGACFLIALEVGIVHYTAQRDRTWLLERFHFIVAEAMVLLVLMRIVATLTLGLETLGADLQRWLLSPLATLDRTFFVCLLVALIVIWLARDMIQSLHALAPQPFEQQTGDDNLSRTAASSLNQERGVNFQRIKSYFVGGGVAMLFAIALQVVDVKRLAAPPLAMSPLTALAGLVYLACGFLLYSQARLSLLQARWRQDGALVDARIARIWNRSSVLLVVTIAVAALLLPRTYGMGLLDTFGLIASYVLWLLSLLLFGVASLILGLIGLILAIPAFLLYWLGLQGEVNPFPAEPLVLPPEPPAPVDSAPESIIPSLIFWACILILSGYALWTVVQRHPLAQHLVARLKSGVLGRVARRLAMLWQRVQHQAQQVSRTLNRQTRHPDEQRMRPAIRLRTLAPRELVRYFYLATLHRAALRGLGRRSSQTPYEYRNTLTEQFPEARDDLTDLTESFIVATYSPRLTTSADAEHARSAWQRLRRYLRLRRAADNLER